MQISGLVFQKFCPIWEDFPFGWLKDAIAAVGVTDLLERQKATLGIRATDSAHWLGIWGWIGPLFTSRSPNPLISTKMDF